ncbi:maleylpyruvate isomerase family mycothiol-dependent enzyme [Nocardia sp. NPDC088792]|uniref:maleylpyruvate isomerase family mycothiol-dependent enzyme n=1 Tax=Nocardia sp. NPDC088792 TaxID=3364332 RepID=UPI00381D1688
MTDIHLWTRERVIATVVEEFKTFATMVHGLSEADLSATTACDGWAVRHVVGHVVGTADDILAFTIGSRTPDEQAAAYLEWSAAASAKALSDAADRMGTHLRSLPDTVWTAPVEGVPGQAFSTGVLTLAHELCVHTDDIDTALGRASLGQRQWELAAQWLAVELERLEFEPLTLELTGLPRYVINGGGPVIIADPVTFVRAATGRAESVTVGVDFDLNIYNRDRRHIGV